MLKHAVLSGGVPISRVAQHSLCTTVGEVLQGARADVLPLPVEPFTPEEGRLLQALSAGTTQAEAPTTFHKSSLRPAQLLRCVGSTHAKAGGADTASAADLSHIELYAESSLCEQTMPAATSLADVSKSVPAVSFEDLDLDANHVGGDVSSGPTSLAVEADTASAADLAL